MSKSKESATMTLEHIDNKPIEPSPPTSFLATNNAIPVILMVAAAVLFGAIQFIKDSPFASTEATSALDIREKGDHDQLIGITNQLQNEMNSRFAVDGAESKELATKEDKDTRDLGNKVDQAVHDAAYAQGKFDQYVDDHHK